MKIRLSNLLSVILASYCIFVYLYGLFIEFFIFVWSVLCIFVYLYGLFRVFLHICMVCLVYFCIFVWSV